jgi:N-acetylglucosamine-6-phosphate deacetylase
VRRAVRECHVPIEVASAAASGNPARVLGIDAECGAIAVGQAAELIALDSDLLVPGVLCDGYWSGQATGWDPRPVGPSLKV